MAVNFQNSRFYHLPNELLTKILKSVDTITLFHFCEVYGCDCFLQDRKVIRKVDLYKQYTCPDLAPLSKKLEFEFVTILNINCLYWIPASKLRPFVSRFFNLEELYAIQTTLGLENSDLDVYNRIKVKKLGFTMTKTPTDLNNKKVVSVETLYLHCMKKEGLGFHRIFPNAINIWVDSEEQQISFPSLKHQKNIIYQFKQCYRPGNILNSYYKSRGHHPYLMDCETDQPLKQVDLAQEGSPWVTLNELKCHIPYNPRDSFRLHLSETLSTIKFEELYLNHGPHGCVDRAREAYKEILKSPCSEKIKRLCIATCLLQNEDDKEVVKIQNNGFSKKRIGVKSIAVSHPVEPIFSNFTKLEELEIFICHRTFFNSAIPAFPLISTFENLHRLQVEIPISLDGSFLIGVLEKCVFLEILKITSHLQNENLNFHLCNALPNAKNLKDFRYENHRIPLDKLLSQLCLIKTQKLQRFMIVCNEIEKFSSGPFKEFLAGNPQLIFLYFVIKECTYNSIKMAQETLNFYRKAHPAKAFFIKKVLFDDMSSSPIPIVHFCEIVKTETNLLKMDALKDFLDF